MSRISEKDTHLSWLFVSTTVRRRDIGWFILSFLLPLLSLRWAEAQQLRKIHVAIPAITPAAAPFAIAKDRGYYREEGLDVDLIVMPSAVGIQALTGGNVSFSTQGWVGLLPALRWTPRCFRSRPTSWRRRAVTGNWYRLSTRTWSNFREAYLPPCSSSNPNRRWQRNSSADRSRGSASCATIAR